MINLKSTQDRKAAVKTLAGIFTNLSAGWFGGAFISPSFKSPDNLNGLIVLILNIFFGIVCLLIAYKFERKLL